MKSWKSNNSKNAAIQDWLDPHGYKLDRNRFGYTDRPVRDPGHGPARRYGTETDHQISLQNEAGLFSPISLKAGRQGGNDALNKPPPLGC
jgi:hypothetical protein